MTVSPYDKIDCVLKDWATNNDLRLHKEFGGEPRRYCYISGQKHESFQISIEPPASDYVAVNVWSVETEDDVDLHKHIDVRVEELRVALDGALNVIKEWTCRSRRGRWGEVKPHEG